MFDRAFEIINAGPFGWPDLHDIFLPESGGRSPIHRSSGTRARRRWKRTRASGIAKRVRR